MRMLTLSTTLGLLFLMNSSSPAQTVEIQNKANAALAKEKDQAKQKDQKVLEDLLAAALHHNPDIGVAESKLREAEAELNRVRLQVTQKVVAQQRELAAAKALVEDGNAKFLSAKQLHERGAPAQEEFRAAAFNLQKVKAELAAIEARLPYLLGSTSAYLWKLEEFENRLRAHPPVPQGSTSPPGGFSPPRLPVRVQFWDPGTGKALSADISSATADNIRKALDTSIKVDFAQVAPKQILEFLQERAKGFNLIEQVKLDNVVPATLHLKEPVPVGAVFQFLEDQYGWRFVVREYGIVVTEKDRVPPGAVDLQGFWKNRGGRRRSPHWACRSRVRPCQSCRRRRKK